MRFLLFLYWIFLHSFYLHMTFVVVLPLNVECWLLPFYGWYTVLLHVCSIHVCRLWLLCFSMLLPFICFLVYGIRFRHLCTIIMCVCIVRCAVRCVFIPFRSFCFGPFVHVLFRKKRRERAGVNSVKGNIQCWPFCVWAHSKKKNRK